MSEKRFKCVFKEHETKNSWSMIKDNQLDKPLYIKDVVDLLNELAEDNELLKSIRESQQQMILKLYEENEQLRKKLECCEYEHLLNKLDEIHEKVDKSDLSDFSPLKEDKPLKEKLHYWQCKYFKRDYEHKRDMCTRKCNYGGLLNYCLKDKCDKIVKRDYEVITEFKNGMSISLKKRGV